MSKVKVCFVVASKHIRGYPTYIKTYVDNINTFYKDSFTLIVDNNSLYIEEDIHFDYTNVKVVTNTSECKFELGAYKFGISYLLENNIVNSYEYFVFTQDTFVLTNYYDFNNLLENNVMACPLVGSSEGHFISDHTSGMSHHAGHKDYDLIKNVISKLNLTETANKLSFCLANSFVLNNSKLVDLLELTRDIKIECKMHSESSERFLAGILYVLNNNINTSVEKKRLEEVFHLIIHSMKNGGSIFLTILQNILTLKQN
jgi:hypothetical protein